MRKKGRVKDTMILSTLLVQLLLQAVAASSPESISDVLFDPKFHEDSPQDMIEPIAEESRVQMSVSEIAEPGIMPEEDSMAVETSNPEFIDSDSLAIESEQTGETVKITPIQGISYTTVHNGDNSAGKNSYLAAVRFPEGKEQGGRVVGNALKSDAEVSSISPPEGWVPNSEPEYSSGETSSPAPRPKVTWPGPVQNQITPQKYQYSEPILGSQPQHEQEQFFYSKENPAGYKLNVGHGLNRGKLVHSIGGAVNTLGTFIREIPRGLGLGLSSVYRMVPPLPVKQAGPGPLYPVVAASQGYATAVSHGAHAISSSFYEGKGWGPYETGGPSSTVVNHGLSGDAQGYAQGHDYVGVGNPVAVKHHSTTGSSYVRNLFPGYSVAPLPPTPSYGHPSQGWSGGQGDGHVTSVVANTQGWSSGQDQGHEPGPVTVKHHSTTGSYVHTPSPGYTPGPPPAEAYGGSTPATPSTVYGAGTGGGSYPPVGDADNGVAPPAPTQSVYEIKEQVNVQGHHGHGRPASHNSFDYSVSNPIPELHKIPVPQPIQFPRIKIPVSQPIQFPRIKIPSFHLVRRPIVINLAIPRVKVPSFQDFRIPLPKFPSVQVSKGHLSGNPTAFITSQGVSGLNSYGSGNSYEYSGRPAVHTSSYGYTPASSPHGSKGTSLSSLYNVPSSSFEDVLSGGHPHHTNNNGHGQGHKVNSISDITNSYGADDHASGDNFGKPLKSYYTTPEEYESILRDLDNSQPSNSYSEGQVPYYKSPKDLRIPTTAGFFKGHSGKWIRIPYRTEVRSRSKGSGYKTIHNIPAPERDPIFLDLPDDHDSSYEFKNPACENKPCDEFDKEKVVEGLKEALEDLLKDNVELKKRKKGGRLRNLILRNLVKEQRNGGRRVRRKCVRRGRGRKRCLFF